LHEGFARGSITAFRGTEFACEETVMNKPLSPRERGWVRVRGLRGIPQVPTPHPALRATTELLAMDGGSPEGEEKSKGEYK
jgi:hypothetical protein